jgi:DNA mismatch repair protein MutS
MKKSAAETPETTIYTDYFRYTKEYQEKYGKNTIVLLQVGAFFEIYGLKNKTTGEIGDQTNIAILSEVCQLNISEKKAAYDKDQNIVMAGFRDYTLDKYLQKLTDYGFTVPVFIQEKNGKQVTRRIDRVYSAGTYVSCETDSLQKITNNIMCIWLESYKPLLVTTRNTIVYGVSVINIFTGKSYIFQYETQFYMNTTTFDELERYVSVYSPCEVLFLSPFDENQNRTILQFCGIRTDITHIINTSSTATAATTTREKVTNCTSQIYIKKILATFFSETVYETCLEFQNRIMATQSFCFLLNYIQEHNPDLVRKIAIPEFNNISDRVILANHTLLQLNVIDDQNADGKSVGKLSSVLGFLNKCSCPMGKRLFQYQMTNPTFNEEWLNREYEMTAAVLAKSDYIAVFRKELLKIRDIEKLCRQLLIKKIYPSSLYHLYTSMESIQTLNSTLSSNGFSEDVGNYLCAGMAKEIENANLYIGIISENIKQFLSHHFIIETCKTTSSMNAFDENIIQKGFSKTLDDLVDKHTKSIDDLHKIRGVLNELIQKNEILSEPIDHVKIHETEKSGMSLQMTAKRSQTLKQILAKHTVLEIDETVKIAAADIKFTKSSTTNVDVEFPRLTEICRFLLTSKEMIQNEIAKVYVELLHIFENRFFNNLEQLAKYVAKLDVLTCKAHIAKEYNYCRPEIEVGVKKSFVDARDLRHCLIEHIQQNELYVTNDVVLGDDKINGVLLYGTNAVGKTSFIRAIGIATIMAQSGMYVPCSRFLYKPYTAIFSRILGNDNIFKGLSTFAVEMSELRIILKMADANSLILGDELCSGTEMESALSIFVTGLMRLHENNASFIFATHFHEITDYDEIKSLRKLALKHMEVVYDREKDCLLYDRKLKDGSGPRIYGLEVCKSLYLDDEFLEGAFKIRNKYYPETRGVLSYAASGYNRKKIRGICEKCGEKTGSEIHHLSPQKDADENGFIGAFHKNHAANLMSVCEKCHLEFHKK